MCDRKNMKDENILFGGSTEASKPSGLHYQAMAEYELYRRYANLIELTAQQIINEQEFGRTELDRPSASELGLALVKANKLGLRLIKGGNRCAKSEDIAKVLVNKLGL